MSAVYHNAAHTSPHAFNNWLGCSGTGNNLEVIKKDLSLNCFKKQPVHSIHRYHLLVAKNIKHRNLL